MFNKEKSMPEEQLHCPYISNYGFVIDYLDLNWFTIFNLADVMISIGTLILFIYLIKLPKKNSR